MTILRLSNGSDMIAKLPLDEVLAALNAASKLDDFVQFEGEDGPFHVRPSGVIALVKYDRRGTAGFRLGSAAG